MPGLQALLTSLSRVVARDGLAVWCRDELAARVPCLAFVCCLGKVEGETIARVETLSAGLAGELPEGELANLVALHERVMRIWLRTDKPVVANAHEAADIVQDAQASGLYRACGSPSIAATGIRDFMRTTVSHFAVFGIEAARCKHQGLLLELLAAPLHAALVRIAHHGLGQDIPVDNLARLTRREREILKWISLGKTNAEIAVILGSQYKTVKNQVQSILVKLRVNNRAQAVAMAANPWSY